MSSESIADEIEQQVLPALQRAIVAADVHGDYHQHVAVQRHLREIARRLRSGVTDQP